MKLTRRDMNKTLALFALGGGLSYQATASDVENLGWTDIVSRKRKGPTLFEPIQLGMGEIPHRYENTFGLTIPNYGYEPVSFYDTDGWVSTFDIDTSLDWKERYHEKGRCDWGHRQLEIVNDNKCWIEEWRIIVQEPFGTGAAWNHRNSVEIFANNFEYLAEKRPTHLYVDPDVRLGKIPRDIEVIRSEDFRHDGDIGKLIYQREKIIHGFHYEDYPHCGVLLLHGEIDEHGLCTRTKYIRDSFQSFEDPTMPRQRRHGVYGWEEAGFVSSKPLAMKTFFS